MFQLINILTKRIRGAAHRRAAPLSNIRKRRLLLKLLHQLGHLVHAAAAVGTRTGGLLNGLQGGVSGFDSGLDVAHGDVAAEAYRLV